MSSGKPRSPTLFFVSDQVGKIQNNHKQTTSMHIHFASLISHSKICSSDTCSHGDPSMILQPNKCRQDFKPLTLRSALVESPCLYCALLQPEHAFAALLLLLLLPCAVGRVKARELRGVFACDTLRQEHKTDGTLTKQTHLRERQHALAL